MSATRILLQGGDMLDVMVDDATRELRSQFMRAYRYAKTWEPEPCPPRVIDVLPDVIYADELPRKPWLRT